MVESTYAFVKDGNVINIAVFDNPTIELFSRFKTELELDDIVKATEKTVIGGTYDGKFWLPKPYMSWIKGLDDWEAPVVKPNDGKVYTWNEETLSWIEVKQITE